jgi:hypothetical protein
MVYNGVSGPKELVIADTRSVSLKVAGQRVPQATESEQAVALQSAMHQHVPSSYAAAQLPNGFGMQGARRPTELCR